MSRFFKCFVFALLLVEMLAMVDMAAALPASQAQAFSAHELPTNLPGATTFEPPPASFNPLTASDQDLADYGLPPRPDQVTAANAFATWSKALSASKTRVTPTLELTGIFHGPAKLKMDAPKGENGTISTYNWSGYIDPNGVTRYGSNSFYYVLGEYVVPIAQQGFGLCSGGWAYSSTWVGLDGYQSADVLQAGTESDAYCSGTVAATYYSPWFEWFPNGETRITNLPVAPGDDYFVEVWNTTATTGHAYLVNENTGQFVTLAFSAPAGASLVGNSAEWILERPNVGASAPPLTNFIAEVFWNAEAVTFAGSVDDPGSASAIEVEMYTVPPPASTLLAYPVLLGPTSFVVNW